MCSTPVDDGVLHLPMNVRHMVHFYEIFSKERREQGRKRLQEEMKKGHFDDFKQLRDTQGKLFRGSPGLLPISSMIFPHVHVMNGRSEHVGTITEVFGSNPKAAVLLCVGCREGAQPMIDAWARAFDDWVSQQQSEADNNTKETPVGIVEMSVVDSFVMSMWPFRSILTGKQTDFQDKYSGADACNVFLFRGQDGFQEVLDMFENRLIGYVYLLDSAGNIRWKGCGFPDMPEEMNHLLKATRALLNTNNKER